MINPFDLALLQNNHENGLKEGDKEVGTHHHHPNQIDEGSTKQGKGELRRIPTTTEEMPCTARRLPQDHAGKK